METRASKVELRATGEALEDSYLEGYAVTWEEPEDHDWYGTVFSPDAFAEDIAERGPDGTNEIILKWLHREPFGMPTELEIDDKGLRLVGRPTNTSENRERMAYVRDGVVRGLSVGFELLAYEVIKDVLTPWGWPVERITRARLREVSPVMDPAVQNAKITDARSYRQRDDGLWLPCRTHHIIDPAKRLSLDVLVNAREALDAVIESERAKRSTERETGDAKLLAALDQINARLDGQLNTE